MILPRAALVLLLAALAGGCALEGAPLVTVDSGGPILLYALPDPESRDVPRRTEPRLVFDRYLDPEPIEGNEDVLELRTGAHRIRGKLRYDPVSRSLILSPAEPLEPHLLYTLELAGPEAIRDVYGLPLVEPPEPFDFLTSAALGVATERPSQADLRRGAALLLSQRCASCHGSDRRAGLPDLRVLDRFLRRAARTRADRRLVTPGHPARSYLMHKLLPGYPDRGGEAMPLGEERLSDAELTLLSEAIRRAW